MLAKVLIDKTARHFDVDTSLLQDDLQDVDAREKKPNEIEPNNEL
jgi:hypothetical protein